MVDIARREWYIDPLSAEGIILGRIHTINHLRGTLIGFYLPADPKDQRQVTRFKKERFNQRMRDYRIHTLGGMDPGLPSEIKVRAICHIEFAPIAHPINQEIAFDQPPP